MTQSPARSICLNPGEEPWPRKPESNHEISWKKEERVPLSIMDNFSYSF